MRTRALLTIAALATSAVLMPAPAQAAARVTISNDQGTAKVDPKYATTVSLSGSGFQSIKGGHGGIYVFFGIRVDGGYLYVPDSETKSNQGFQKFVTFPGNTQTGDAANGGELKANGTWSTKLVIPGATFQAVNRSGKKQTVDCLKSTCGIITFGAHGVKNPRNETFTPVSFADLYAGQAPEAAATEDPAPANAGAAVAPDGVAPTNASEEPAKPKAAAKAQLTVDRTTTVAGRVLAFNATGLTPGNQIVATLDDGVAAVGPLNVGPNGQVAGVLRLPPDLTAGTHELRLIGSESALSVNFPVRSATLPVADEPDSDTPWLPIGFAALAAVALLLALIFSVIRIRSIRRAAAHAV